MLARDVGLRWLARRLRLHYILKCGLHPTWGEVIMWIICRFLSLGEFVGTQGPTGINVQWGLGSRESGRDARVHLLGRGAAIAPYVAILLGAK